VRGIGAIIRLVLLVSFLLVAFLIWLGRVGLALGAGGLAGTVLIAFIRGELGKRKLDAAMREADRAAPPERPPPYR
jgi:hypothetical protein